MRQADGTASTRRRPVHRRDAARFAGSLGGSVLAAAALAGCGGPTPLSAGRSTPTAPASTAGAPVLGAAGVRRCTGCGATAPATFTISAYQQSGQYFGGAEIQGAQWRGWGTAQATASATILFIGPGESTTGTVVAFDLGACQGRPAYRAVEWFTNPGSFHPNDYFDVCTGTGVGSSWPPG